MDTGNIVGTRLGKYQLHAEIGRGGMGAVYKGYDPMLDRWVAVKVLAPHLLWEKEFVERFLREARAAARLKHPGIVTIYDVGQEADWYYFVMEYLEGQTLTEVIQQRGPLPPGEVIRVLRALAEALDYAHHRGLVHRDVKPRNVIVDPAQQVTLTDFGIARAAQETRLTATGAIVGTPEYMSPEQVKGLTVDARSDQYSLAVVAYEMLSGEVPFQAESTLALLHKIAYDPPPPIRQKRPDLAAEVGDVLERALAKEPGERYGRCAEFVNALERATLGVQKATLQRKARPAPQPAPPEPRLEPRPVATHPPQPEPRPAPPPISRPRARKERRGIGAVPGWAWALGAVSAVAVLALGVALALRTSGPRTLTETPTPSANLGDTWSRPADEMVMVYVPAGEFEMGSTEGDSDEQPVHTVALDGFWIDRTEVTNARYALCVKDGACEESAYADDAKFNGDDYPVVSVSWHDAAGYCTWAGARLPAEAEWEYAARGPQAYVYPWGNDAPTCELAQFAECSGRTVPVGSLPDGASWCGAMDMAGNVWEWVADRVGDYPSGRQVNPTGPSSGEVRMLRGGSWDDVSYGVRGAYRNGGNPDDRLGSLGFRCARGSE